MDARGLRTVGGCVAALALLGACASAQAATVTLGPNQLKGATMNAPNGSPPGCGSGSAVCLYFNVSAGGPAYIAPFSGVINTWRVSTGSASGTLTLRVLRPASGSSYTVVASSASHPNATTGVQTFSDTIPVNSGDTIALQNESNAILFGPGATANQVDWMSTASPLADGATMSPNGNTSPSYCGGGPCEAQFNVDLVESTPSGTGPAGPPLGTPPPPRPHLLPAPTLTGLGVTPSRFSLGAGAPRLAAVGARIRFTLNLAALVRFSFARTSRRRALRRRESARSGAGTAGRPGRWPTSAPGSGPVPADVSRSGPRSACGWGRRGWSAPAVRLGAVACTGDHGPGPPAMAGSDRRALARRKPAGW